MYSSAELQFLYHVSACCLPLYFYAALLVLLLLYFVWTVIRARKGESKPPNYATDLLLGMAFVLVTSFSGPLVLYLRDPYVSWWLGLLLTGFIQWLYVIPAIVIAKRKENFGFRNGALGAAVILLLLDLVSIVVLVPIFAKALSGLR